MVPRASSLGRSPLASVEPSSQRNTTNEAAPSCRHRLMARRTVASSSKPSPLFRTKRRITIIVVPWSKATLTALLSEVEGSGWPGEAGWSCTTSHSAVCTFHWPGARAGAALGPCTASHSGLRASHSGLRASHSGPRARHSGLRAGNLGFREGHSGLRDGHSGPRTLHSAPSCAPSASLSSQHGGGRASPPSKHSCTGKTECMVSKATRSSSQTRFTFPIRRLSQSALAASGGAWANSGMPGTLAYMEMLLEILVSTVLPELQVRTSSPTGHFKTCGPTGMSAQSGNSCS
mmetsp:Transcript_4855/g.13392  ORF Transcript_4855/g.13392 Transcript_4855/m.13392 type:complete len:290 (+) Transcript_4855:427-1296(+)